MKEDEELKAIEALVRQREQEHERAVGIGSEFSDLYKDLDLSYQADVLGSLLTHWYRQSEETGEGCGSLLIEWMFERMWGNIIREYVDDVIQYKDRLGKFSRKDPLVWNDCDMRAWVEHDVLIIKNEASMADDNIFLFILDQDPLGTTLHARTCYPRLKRSVLYPQWDGWAGVDKPSLNFYRKMGFRLAYGDCRDKGYCFTYSDKYQRKVDRAGNYLPRIESALFTLRGLGDELG